MVDNLRYWFICYHYHSFRSVYAISYVTNNSFFLQEGELISYGKTGIETMKFIELATLIISNNYSSNECSNLPINHKQFCELYKKL